MKLPAVARIPMALIVAVATGCSLAPAAQPTATPQPTITLIPTANPLPTSTPARPDLPTPLATPASSDTPAPTKKPPPPDEFPLGRLRAGDAAVEGSPGSYCYKDTCADLGQWPRKSDLPELVVGAADAELEFSLPESVRFVTWDVAYSASSDEDNSTELAKGGYPYDPDANPTQSLTELSRTTFPAPSPGDWVVWVWVQLRSGDLSYAWHVFVS